MRRHWVPPAAIVCPALAVAAGVALAQVPLPVGSEFQVNLNTDNSQNHPAVSAEANGDFVVVWDSVGEDGDGYGVFGRRFNSAGVSLGTAFQVGLLTIGTQFNPDVALDSDGDFVVVWQGALLSSTSYGVIARRFSSAGAGLSAEILVNSYQPDAQLRPAVAIDGNGDFVVVWQNLLDGSGNGIFARRFSSSGTSQGAQFLVNTATANDQTYPAIELEADGDFVVVWHSNQDPFHVRIFGRSFTSSGTPLASEFQISIGANDQTSPAVGLDSFGNARVVWRSTGGQDGSMDGVSGRRFLNFGNPISNEIPINDGTSGNQRLPAVSVESDGDFVVTWRGDAQSALESAGGILTRRFRADGLPVTFDLQVNSTTEGEQSQPAIAGDADGDFVVVWTSPHDGEGYGIFAQRFDVQPSLDVDGDGAFLPLTDGLLLLRFGFGFTGAVLTNGAIGPNCTRCDSFTIGLYLQSLL